MAPLRSLIVLAALATALGAREPAHAAEAPAFSVELRDTADFWRNLQGGLRRGNTSLNKLSAAVTFDGEAAGIAGFRAYVQVFRTNAQSLSLARTGDIQTASNIEAPRVDRLFELWAEQSRGSDDAAGWLMVRGGVIDLNRTFDSISTAGLFLSSSHGIAPDLSKSGLSGPSIFPVAGPAIQAGWRGTVRRAVIAAVAAMQSRYGIRPERLMAAVGPCIGPCCYEVDESTLRAFRDGGHHPSMLNRWFSPRPDGKYHLDLWTATRDELEGAGVHAANIHVSELCTKTHAAALHSFRADGEHAGRMVSVIRARE